MFKVTPSPSWVEGHGGIVHWALVKEVIVLIKYRPGLVNSGLLSRCVSLVKNIVFSLLQRLKHVLIREDNIPY